LPRWASTLNAPAPKATIARRPPLIAMFFQNISDCIICCSAGMAQKLWKNSDASKVNTASASAYQRVNSPISSSKPAPTSIAIVPAANTCGIGKPFDAM
jgi:hypothetical protein